MSLGNIALQLGDHEASVLHVVLDLIEAGFATQILPSQDVGQMAELGSRGGRGYTYLAERFLPALRDAGVDEPTLATLTVENPRRWLMIADGETAD